MVKVVESQLGTKEKTDDQPDTKWKEERGSGERADKERWKEKGRKKEERIKREAERHGEGRGR